MYQGAVWNDKGLMKVISGGLAMWREWRMRGLHC